MELRPYQQESIKAVNEYLKTKEGNPCVVLPTGSGKSLVMAQMIKEWKTQYPPLRVCILAHRTELVEQNSAELQGISDFKIGIYAAKLKRRDYDDIIFASIDSIYNRANEFFFDVLIIDESHRIPAKGEGKYRKFIEGVTRINPKNRVIGLTATPYRLGSGLICDKHFILNEIVYEANTVDLIEQGYLCRLRSKVTATLDLSEVKKSGGDYNQKQLDEVVNTDTHVHEAVNNMISICKTEKRRSIIIFCVSVAHCKAVSALIESMGYTAPYVTGKTPTDERRELIEGFRDRKYSFLVSVNVFLEGFNVKHIDCVVVMRPTKSKGLWIQAVGRGLRLHEDKQDCLILDYGNNILEHGPIGEHEEHDQRIHICEQCSEVFPYVLKKCPTCELEIPKKEIERREAVEERRIEHEKEAAQLDILKRARYSLKIDNVTALRHKKSGNPDSVKITYICGVNRISEWICLDHEGYAGNKAKTWMIDRHLSYSSVDDALSDLFLGQKILEKTEEIVVTKPGKYFNIEEYKLR